MVMIRKARAGSAPGYVWERDGAVVDVDRDLAGDLLRIPDGGFSEVFDTVEEPAPEQTPSAPESKGRRGRKTVEEPAPEQTPVEE